MKEFLFIIVDATNDVCNFIKVSASTLEEAQTKFAKAFCPFVDFSFSDINDLLYNTDVDIYYSEYKDVITLV